MQKFWLPGYEMQLVGELQRQQNSSQFCDTLLQTEGISVPTHSCVLAALSPYLCQRLSASPSPPSGQKRQLQLQTVTAQTLLKLVSLLYSGELEVRGSKEQSDVLAAAHQLGIGHLVLGYKDGWAKDGELLYRRQSVGIHAGETRQRHRGLKMQDAQVQAEMNGMRENDPRVKKKSFVSVATQTVKAGVISSISVPSDQTQECPPSVATFPIPLQPQGITPNDQLGLSCPAVHSEFTVGRSSISETNATPSSTLSASLSDDPTSPRSQEENVSKQLSEAGDVTFVVNDNKTRQEKRKTNPQMTEDGGSDTERPRQVCRDEKKTPGEERNSAGKRRMGGKSLENMKRMETKQISVKMKFKRTTEEKAWRVVRVLDEDKTSSLLASEQQGGSNLQTPQMYRTSASSVLPVQNPEAPHLHPVIATSPQPSKHGGKNSEAQSDPAPDHSRELEVLPQPPGSVEEPDEDIDRMLDEIMMGLNILPSLNENCRTAQTSHDGRQNFCLSTDADKFCDSVAEVYPETSGSILPSTCVLREPKLHFPGLQPLSSQEDRSVLPFFPLSRDEEPLPEQIFSLACLNELRLPRPISPLEPRSPEAEQQPLPNESFVSPEKDVQQSFLRRPWLTEAPWSLHFPPLYALSEVESKLLPRGSNTSCDSEQLCVGRKANDTNTCAETVGDVKERGNQSQPEEKSDPKKMKRKQVATGDAAAPKKRRRRLKDSLDQYLDSKIPTRCSVSLSSSNVLAIQQKMTTNPSNSARMSLDKTNQKATIQTSVEENTRTVGNLDAQQTPIRTRSFAKRSVDTNGDKIPKKSVLIPVVCKTEAKEKQCAAVLKRRRGRPRKKNLDPPPLRDGPDERNCNEASEQNFSKLEAKDGAKKRRRKLRTSTSEAEKSKRVKCVGMAEENDNAKDPQMQKQSLMATLKEFQKFIKRQRRKSTESQETNELGGEEKTRDALNGSNIEAEVEIKESVKIQDPDKNQNYLFNSSAARCNRSLYDGANGSTGQKKGCHEDHLSSEDVLVDKMEPSSDQRQLLKNPAEGALCWTGASEAVQSVISDESGSHRDAKLPQATETVLSQRTGPPSTGGDGPGVTPPHCDREEEDEEEVDVLLFSPEKALPVEEREEGTNNIVILSGDEEEEANEIDVTGDEEE